MRILVTGSRTWDDYHALAYVLARAVARAPLRADVVVMHGDCPDGADVLVEQWCQEAGITTECYPGAPGKFLQRNRDMVAAGADLCLAFIRNNSTGATYTADHAERSGIPTKRYRYERKS